MKAPAVGAHHRQVGLLLLQIEGLEGFTPQFWIEPATGTTAADALPLRLNVHAAVSAFGGWCPFSHGIGHGGPDRCDKPSQREGAGPGARVPDLKVQVERQSHEPVVMGIDFHLIANFGALALITLAGPAVIFILFYRRGAL